MQLFKTLRLATRDYQHEWKTSICFVLGLSAVLGPMMVLYGLKVGVIGGMFNQLIENPINREIRPVSSGRYERAWLGALHRRDDVTFVVPHTRNIAAMIELQSQRASRIIKAETIPSDHGDPLLDPIRVTPTGLHAVVLSRSAANKLKVDVGDTISGSIKRRYRDQSERVHIDLKIIGIAPLESFARDGVFADLRLVEALEDFRDGHAVPALGWTGDVVTGERTYPGFRLYARSIYDVENLERLLNEAGIDVRTRSTQIALVVKMERNLNAIYWLIALIGLVGFALSLGASLWANIDHKRKELSVLRLVGFRTGDIIWFPMIQAFYTAVLGTLLAVGLFQGVAWLINDLLGQQLSNGEPVCILYQEHYIAAAVLTIVTALISAILAGIRAARIEPSDGLREL